MSTCANSRCGWCPDERGAVSAPWPTGCGTCAAHRTWPRCGRPESPDELARLALIPAARNLGIAAGFLPADLRTEATAALLACRVLDAYEDLSDRPRGERRRS